LPFPALLLPAGIAWSPLHGRGDIVVFSVTSSDRRLVARVLEIPKHSAGGALVALWLSKQHIMHSVSPIAFPVQIVSAPHMNELRASRGNVGQREFQLVLGHTVDRQFKSTVRHDGIPIIEGVHCHSGDHVFIVQRAHRLGGINIFPNARAEEHVVSIPLIIQLDGQVIESGRRPTLPSQQFTQNAEWLMVAVVVVTRCHHIKLLRRGLVFVRLALEMVLHSVPRSPMRISAQECIPSIASRSALGHSLDLTHKLLSHSHRRRDSTVVQLAPLHNRLPRERHTSARRLAQIPAVHGRAQFVVTEQSAARNVVVRAFDWFGAQRTLCCERDCFCSGIEHFQSLTGRHGHGLVLIRIPEHTVSSERHQTPIVSHHQILRVFMR